MTERLAGTPPGSVFAGDVVHFTKPVRFGRAITGWMTARTAGGYGESCWINGTDTKGRARSIECEYITIIHRAGSRQAVIRMKGKE